MPKDSLTPTEGKLLEAARNGTPVLLHGADTIGRKELVLKAHMLNGGIDSGLEYFDDNGNLVSREDYVKSIGSWMISTEKDKLKTYHSRSTQRTWDYVSCADMIDSKVYYELMKESIRIKREFDEYEEAVFKRITNNKSHTPGAFFHCNGTLFLDNLNVYDQAETTYYNRLAEIIRNKGIDYRITTFEWLVVYTHDLNSLPAHFRDQFQVISLESTPEKQEQANEQDAISGNIFRKEGEYWTIQYNGKLTRINDYVGLRYIAYLLKEKDKDFYINEVIQEVNKEQFQSIQNDFKSKVESKRQNDFFNEEQELDIYDQNITIKTLITNDHEKLRKRISKNITDAQDKIKQYDNDLWKHLSSSISTGHTLSYKPKDHIVWNI